MSQIQSAYAGDPSYLGGPNTGERLAEVTPDAVRRLWKAGVDTFEETSDFFAEMEGRSPLSLIQTETDTSKGAGQTITFTVDSGLYGEAHLGESLFTDSKHYEELKLGTNDLTVDWFRHGVRFTERSEEKMGMRGELIDRVPEKLGEWAGRLKTEKMFMMFREQTPGENHVTIDGGLNWESIVTNAQMMKRWGAAPAIVARDPAGKPVRAYTVISTTDGLTSLKLDSDYREILKSTRDPMGAKYIFSGGFTPVDGHVIKEYEAIEHDGYGAIGSPLNPMARLGAEVNITSASAATAQTIAGGGGDLDLHNDLIKPMKWFPRYAYQFQAGVSLSTEQMPSSFFVAIINPPDAEHDANKYGLYECSGNDGVKLTIKKALTSSAVANAAATGSGPELAPVVGTMHWDDSKHSNRHPVNSLVVIVGPDAIPRFKSLIIGASAARRGYGKVRNGRAVQEHEGGFVRDVFFKTVFGQAVRKNRLGRAPGVLVLDHKGMYAGTPLPTH